MKAIGFKRSLPIEDEQSFIEFETEIPTPKGHQILVKIKAIAVNPADTKFRKYALGDKELPEPKIIGWDAAGEVVGVGDEVELFKIGDEVYYSGQIDKPGCYAEYQVVDERIVGHKPKNLSMVQAAALAVPALTVWELLLDRMYLSKENAANKTLLIIGGAGGVGTYAIQFAKKILGMKVIATASRHTTIEWCLDYGADLVVNHRELLMEMQDNGYPQVDYIIDLANINQHWKNMVELIAPEGRIGSISDATGPIDLAALKNKSVSFAWEFTC
ncbi:MAG: zinc-binding alcohol dehydrogenase family protein, partial [Pseudopedobacter saltans]